MMRAASKFNIFWMPHVLPLYAVRFRLSPEEALQLLASLNLEQWVDGDRKEVGIRELTRQITPSFLQVVHNIGGISMPCLNVPEMAGIQHLYCVRFGIDLSTAYSIAMDLDSKYCDEGFMRWYIALTHVVGTSLQLLCCVRVSEFMLMMF